MNYKSTILHPAGKDPLFKQLLEYKWSRVFFAFIAVYIIVLFPVILSWFEGNFINPLLKIDALHDVGYIVQFIILLPFFILFIPYYLNALEDALLLLKDRRVVKITDEQYQKFADDANEKNFKHPLITWAPLFITTGVYIFSLFTFWIAGHNTWNSPAKNASFTPAAILSTIPTFFLYYILSGFIFRIVAICFVIRNYLSVEVIIHPLHPDKAGGLSPLGKFSLRITIAGIIVGICCLIGVFVNYYQYKLKLFSTTNLMIIIFYVLGLTIVFFVPLLSARKGMFAAKKGLLQEISDKFNIAISKAMSNLKINEGNAKINIDQIEDLTKLYKVANGMPIYPFNAENIVTFFSSVLWPIILIFIKWIITKI